jgi:hypothetical protein
LTESLFEEDDADFGVFEIHQTDAAAAEDFIIELEKACYGRIPCVAVRGVCRMTMIELDGASPRAGRPKSRKSLRQRLLGGKRLPFNLSPHNLCFLVRSRDPSRSWRCLGTRSRGCG